MATSAMRIWGWPLALGVLTATGLLSALVSDTWGDAWSWVGLGIPVLAMIWFGLRRQPDRARFHASTRKRA
ncbi:hypothetical protein CDO44_16590 [Pigmentiphaga sp. NML080357]|uniref:hypothetical protein n=1 Tax=Pigmentiphaga sp. NML080357 TaxID=2008675 RepID=UPI000B40CA09|nr:hypothetical protein [Pigmentiphaga sp. NML080357]OVZ57991.1 hypothetical protein CDO44_16590 [Pigmentiphaga sp. NML080357]